MVVSLREIFQFSFTRVFCILRLIMSEEDDNYKSLVPSIKAFMTSETNRVLVQLEEMKAALAGQASRIDAAEENAAVALATSTDVSQRMDRQLEEMKDLPVPITSFAPIGMGRPRTL